MDGFIVVALKWKKKIRGRKLISLCPAKKVIMMMMMMMMMMMLLNHRLHADMFQSFMLLLLLLIS